MPKQLPKPIDPIPMRVAVYGLMRSGTTLLSDLLTIRGRSVVISEPDLFVDWHKPTIARVNGLLRDVGLPLPAEPPHEVPGRLYADYFVEEVIPQFAKLDYWGVKQVNFFDWQQLFERHPPERLVLCTRDIREIVISSLDLICRLGLAFPGGMRLHDEAWIMCRIVYGVHELMAMRQHPHLLVRYEDLVADPAKRQELAGYVGLDELGDERLNLESERRARSDWELSKHGGAITDKSTSRFEQEPAGPIRALAERIWRLLPGYSEAFGYETPPPAERLTGHAFAHTDAAGKNPIHAGLAEVWNWPGPKGLEPSFARRRARIVAAANLPEGARVADLACSLPAMRFLVPKGSAYQAYDIKARDPKMIAWTPGNGEPPHARNATHLVLIGALEYLPDPLAVLTGLHALGRPILTSYHASDDTVGEDRSAFGWCNHYSRQELMQLFATAGFRVTPLWAFDKYQSLFRLIPQNRQQT